MIINLDDLKAGDLKWHLLLQDIDSNEVGKGKTLSVEFTVNNKEVDLDRFLKRVERNVGLSVENKANVLFEKWKREYHDKLLNDESKVEIRLSKIIAILENALLNNRL
jgi:hypothetical protein